MREMRAAIYARVACATQQTKQAIVSQLEALRDHATTSGMEIIEEFTDEGYSGLRLDRPGLDRMRDLAECRGFDVLLMWSGSAGTEFCAARSDHRRAGTVRSPDHLSGQGAG
jgi:DNA invertase Pin-like site-specific DNA recombinase